MFSGCATKVYKYKKLKWSKSDDYDCENDETDEDLGMSELRGKLNADGEESCLVENTSRSTSVTLMSFDYTYWKQVRTLRLKYYLLRPRTLNLLTSRVKSFPNTPTHTKKRKSEAGVRGTKKTVCFTTGRDPSEGREMKEKLLVKSISLSDTNLETVKRRKGFKMGSGRDNDRARVTVNPADYEESQGACGAELAGTRKNKTTSLSSSTSFLPISLRYTPNPNPNPDSSPTAKQKKEKENLKRKETGRTRRKRRKDELGTHEMEMEKADSQLLLKKHEDTSAELHSSSENCNNSTSDVNSMNDFEMDYYDYDILNAGNIPGSYLLEPSYAFWTDSMYDEPVSGSDLGNPEIEMMSTSIGRAASSVGLFTPEPSSSSKDLVVKETSFDTFDSQIKFADDEDEDEDTRTISDSVEESNDKERGLVYLSSARIAN